jgi:type VI secretion system protein ImpH
MASEAGSPPDPLSLLAQLQTPGIDFFEALRRVECGWPLLPRLGTATRPADEPVRLGQQPSLSFAPTMLAKVEAIEHGRLRVLGFFLGLFGPQGPLPLHLTEYAHDRTSNDRDPTFAAFADVFHHRMLSLFYRAWADSRPTVQFDRPEQDRFARHVAALIGIADESLRNRDAWPDRAKLFFAGHLSAATRTRAALESLLRTYLELPVEVEECVGQWLQVERDEQLRLGADRNTGTLGSNALLGAAVWNAQTRLQLVIGPVTVGQLMQFLPGSASLGRLRALMLNFLGYEYAWNIRFRVKRENLPGVQLGRFGHLGWTSWTSPSRTGAAADDVIIEGS